MKAAKKMGVERRGMSEAKMEKIGYRNDGRDDPRKSTEKKISKIAAKR